MEGNKETKQYGLDSATSWFGYTYICAWVHLGERITNADVSRANAHTYSLAAKKWR